MSAEVTRVLLETSPVDGMPGWETRLFLITYPPGADGSNHAHPVVGIGLVLGAPLVWTFDAAPQEIPPAGKTLQERASFHRVSRNGSATEPMKFVIAYTAK